MAFLIDIFIPLSFTILFLFFPQVFLGKNESQELKEKRVRKLRTCGYILLVATLLIALSNLPRIDHHSELSAESVINQIIIETNSKLPAKLSETTTAEKIYAEDKKLVFPYTIQNSKFAQVDKDEYIKAIKQQIMGHIKNHPSAGLFQTDEISLDFVYKDANSAFEIVVHVTPEDYKSILTE